MTVEPEVPTNTRYAAGQPQAGAPRDLPRSSAAVGLSPAHR
jgi:hypothetical protein